MKDNYNKDRLLKIINGTILTPYRVLQGGCVVVKGDKIVEVAEKDIDLEDATVIDAKGLFVSPGFIDIHIHGGGGCDFMDNEKEGYLKIAAMHAHYGTTSMVPTTLTCEKEDLLTTLSLFKEVKNQTIGVGANFLGLHLEGPYFSKNQCGAQDPRFIKDPDPVEYKEILSLSDDIIRWSAAPERKGALEFGAYLQQKGVMPAIAHTDAIYEEVLEAFEKGFRHATHFYSAMSGVTRRNAYRYAGVIESCYLLDEMTVEIIADGVHLPASLLKLIYKIKGPDRISLITDAMRAAGVDGNESVLGSYKNGMKVIIEDGVAKLPDRSAFAGSTATADRLVRNMVQMAEVPLLEAVRMMTASPAKVMKVDDRKGELIKGKDADIVLFDQNIQIQETIIGGRRVYQRD